MQSEDRSRRDAELLERIGWSQIEANEKRRQRRNFWVAFGFMAPAVALVSGLLLAPVVYNIYLSFTKWKKFKGMDDFAGVANYERLSTHRLFGEALYNTSLWVVASIIFLPRILAPTAVGVIWFYVYAPDGVVNRFLSFAAGDKVDIGFLYQENTGTPAIIATFVWQTVGLVMVLILLGLAAIPRDPLEAARIDGATRWQVFRSIVMPLLLPTILVVTILSVLSGFTVFDLLWIMGAANPELRTLSLAVFMYFEAFQKGSWAYGSAIAVIIGVVVLSVTWIQALLQHRVEKMTK